jgi:hypothetical protein
MENIYFAQISTTTQTFTASQPTLPNWLDRISVDPTQSSMEKLELITCLLVQRKEEFTSLTSMENNSARREEFSAVIQ